jgi:hypothetical protein
MASFERLIAAPCSTGMSNDRALVPEKKANDVTDQIILPNGRRFGYFVPDNFDPARGTQDYHIHPWNARTRRFLASSRQYSRVWGLCENDVEAVPQHGL